MNIYCCLAYYLLKKTIGSLRWCNCNNLSFSERRMTQTWWTVTLWISTLRFSTMTESTGMLFCKTFFTKAEERPSQKQEDSKKSDWPLLNGKMKKKNHLHFLLKFLTRVSVIPTAMFSFYLERRTTQTFGLLLCGSPHWDFESW